MYLAQNLRYLREQSRMSQGEIAKAFETSQPVVWNWEAGRREPDLNTVVQLAEYFCVSLDELVLRDLRPAVPLYASNIEYLRTKHGIALEDMAVLLGFKGKRALCAVEAGKMGLSIEKLEKLADFFGVTLDQLVKQDFSKRKDEGDGKTECDA